MFKRRRRQHTYVVPYRLEWSPTNADLTTLLGTGSPGKVLNRNFGPSSASVRVYVNQSVEKLSQTHSTLSRRALAPLLQCRELRSFSGQPYKRVNRVNACRLASFAAQLLGYGNNVTNKPTSRIYRSTCTYSDQRFLQLENRCLRRAHQPVKSEPSIEDSSMDAIVR